MSLLYTTCANAHWSSAPALSTLTHRTLVIRSLLLAHREGIHGNASLGLHSFEQSWSCGPVPPVDAQPRIVSSGRQLPFRGSR